MITEKDKEFADTLLRLCQSGYITIGVNIEPEYAESGDGQWNVTRTYIKVGEEWTPLDIGRAEIIEGV